MYVLVIGGTGVISREIVKRLLALNHNVAVLNRGSRSLDYGGEVESFVGDRRQEGLLKKIARENRFDAVIDVTSFDRQDAKVLMDAFDGYCRQAVICSSSAAYEKGYTILPIREDTQPLMAQNIYPYGYFKADMERYLAESDLKREISYTVIRPSLTFGEGCANLGTLRQNSGVVDRIRRGKPLVVFGDGTDPWCFTFAPDLAKGFCGVLLNERCYGQAYHVTNSDIHQWSDLYATFGRLIGIEPKIVCLPSSLLCEADSEFFAHLYHEKMYANIYDNSKIKRDVPGFEATVSLEQGLGALLAWYERDHIAPDPRKDAYEDALVEAYECFRGKMAKIGRL